MHGLTQRVVEALTMASMEVRPAAIRVVARPSPELETLVAGLEGATLFSTAPSLAEHLAWADLCVCTGGLTKYEAAYVGIPPLVISQTSEQASDTMAFSRRGLAIDLGLGPKVTDSELITCLHEALADRLRLDRVRAALDEFFPLDPTGAAARTLKSSLLQGAHA